jgi:hypothetical protein
MRTVHTALTALALLASPALLFTTALPASAQNLTFTLSGVTFSDGATASGFFDFNPTTDQVGNFDFTTTNGVTDTATGATYDLANETPGHLALYEQVYEYPPAGPWRYVFMFASGPELTPNEIDLETTVVPNTTGTYTILPGHMYWPIGWFRPSEEITPVSPDHWLQRSVTGGDLVVTPAAVPEASSMISFAILIGAGACLLIWRKRTAA